MKSEDIESELMNNQEETRVQEEDSDDNIIPRDTLLQRQREIWNPINSATTTRNKKKSIQSLIKTRRNEEDTDSYITDEQRRSNEPNKNIQAVRTANNYTKNERAPAGNSTDNINKLDNKSSRCTINHDSGTAKNNSVTLEYTYPTHKRDYTTKRDGQNTEEEKIGILEHARHTNDTGVHQDGSS